MRSTLEYLIFETGLTYTQFAEKVGIPLKTLEGQLQEQLHNHINLSIRYAKVFGIKKIQGYNELGEKVKIKITTIKTKGKIRSYS